MRFGKFVDKMGSETKVIDIITPNIYISSNCEIFHLHGTIQDSNSSYLNPQNLIWE